MARFRFVPQAVGAANPSGTVAETQADQTVAASGAVVGSGSVGDIAHWRDSAGSQLPTTSWAGFNFATQVRSDSTDYSKPNNSTVQFGTAGDYLLLWHIKGQDSSNGRHAPQTRSVVSTGSGAHFTTYNSGYNRNTANDEFGCWGISFYRASINDQVQIQWRCDTDTPTGGTVANESDLQVVRLGDSYNYGIYQSNSSGNAYGGVTPNDVAFATTVLETDTSAIAKQANNTDIRLAGSADARYLIAYGVAGDTSDSSRTQRISRVVSDSTEVEASRSYFYQRNSANEFTGLGAALLYTKSASTNDISIQVYRGDGINADDGGGDVDGGWVNVAAQTQCFVCELPDHVEVFASYDQTGLQTVGGGVTTTINAARTVSFNDSTSFTKASDTALNVVQASDAYVWSNIHTARQTVSSGTRLTLGARIEIDGVDQTLGCDVSYTRGNQGSADTFGGSWHPGGFFAFTAGQDVEIETFDLGDNGGGDRTQPNTSGMFAINLDTLEATATAVTGSLAETQANQTSSGSATSTISGSVAETQAANTLTATGTAVATITGSLSETQANQTATIAGANTVGSSLSESQAANTLAASATNEIGATLSSTSADQTLAAQATQAVDSALAETQGDQTASIDGAVATGSSLNETQDGQTLAASATNTVDASLNVTVSNDTVSATATNTVDSALSETQADQSGTATGTAVTGGSLAETQDSQTLAATATNTVGVTLSVTEADDTVSASASVQTDASLSVTQSDNTLAASATAITGSQLAETQDSQTLSASATNEIGASLAQTADDQTLSASSSAGVEGSLAETQASQTVSATGGIEVGASLAETQADQTVSASAVNTVDASSAVNASDNTSTATGTVANPVSGSLAVTALADELAASGVVALPVSGSLSVTEIADQLTASALVQTIGVADQPLSLVVTEKGLSLSVTASDLSLQATLDAPDLASTTDALTLSATLDNLDVKNG